MEGQAKERKRQEIGEDVLLWLDCFNQLRKDILDQSQERFLRKMKIGATNEDSRFRVQSFAKIRFDACRVVRVCEFRNKILKIKYKIESEIY